MKYKPLHCWDCGTQVIEGERGAYTARPNFRQVRFSLADGSYCESPFCDACAARPWTTDRALAFEHAVNVVDPRCQIRVMAVEGFRVETEPIITIVRPSATGTP